MVVPGPTDPGNPCASWGPTSCVYLSHYGWATAGCVYALLTGPHTGPWMLEYAAAIVREPLGVLCDELLSELAQDSTDDVALLALRLPPAAG